jgi:hypothetical protein
MGVELVRALAMIYRNTNAPNNHYKVFEKFLNAQANADGTLQKTSLTFKLLGGNKNHKQEQCIALGFLEKFKDWASANNELTKKTTGKHFNGYIKTLKNKINNNQ